MPLAKKIRFVAQKMHQLFENRKQPKKKVTIMLNDATYMAEELLHFWESIPFIPTTGMFRYCTDHNKLTKATSACGTGSLARTNCGTLTPAGSSVAL